MVCVFWTTPNTVHFPKVLHKPLTQLRCNSYEPASFLSTKDKKSPRAARFWGFFFCFTLKKLQVSKMSRKCPATVPKTAAGPSPDRACPCRRSVRGRTHSA